MSIGRCKLSHRFLRDSLDSLLEGASGIRCFSSVHFQGHNAPVSGYSINETYNVPQQGSTAEKVARGFSSASKSIEFGKQRNAFRTKLSELRKKWAAEIYEKRVKKELEAEAIRSEREAAKEARKRERLAAALSPEQIELARKREEMQRQEREAQKDIRLKREQTRREVMELLREERWVCWWFVVTLQTARNIQSLPQMFQYLAISVCMLSIY